MIGFSSPGRRAGGASCLRACRLSRRQAADAHTRVLGLLKARLISTLIASVNAGWRRGVEGGGGRRATLERLGGGGDAALWWALVGDSPLCAAVWQTTTVTGLTPWQHLMTLWCIDGMNRRARGVHSLGTSHRLGQPTKTFVTRIWTCFSCPACSVVGFFLMYGRYKNKNRTR